MVDNVIKYGVGGINIDECRVGNQKRYNPSATIGKDGIYNWNTTTNKNENYTGQVVNGRFPANLILTYDETDFDEVCGGFPNTKPAGNKIGKNINKNLDYNASSYKLSNNKCPKIAGDNGGSAARYFMNCKYTGKDEEIWKQLLVNNVGNNLEILKATKDNIVQMNVEDLLKELKDHYAKYVDNQLDLIETPIVQDIVKMLTWDFKIETSQVIQDFIINSKKMYPIPEPCAICGKDGQHRHHPDYSKPFEIVWLCESCHHKLHSGKHRVRPKEIHIYTKSK